MALEPQQKKSSVKTTEYILPDCCCCFNEDQQRVQLSDPSVHTPCTPKAEHTGCTLGHSTFQKRPRSHARHTPSRPHDTTSPHWATNICQPGRRVTAGEETPTPHPRLLGLHKPEIRTLCDFFLTPSTFRMDFTNATHSAGCHILPRLRAGGRTRSTNQSLTRGPWSGINQSPS